MTKEEFILKLFHEGQEWLKIIIPAIIAWHVPQPKYMRKKQDERTSKQDTDNQ